MKFLIVGDLHGQKPKIHFKDFDAIIAPGDFCSDTTRKYMFKAKKKEVKWYDVVDKQILIKEIKKSLNHGRKVLEYLNSFGVPVYVVPGNREWSYLSPKKFLPIGSKNYKNLIRGLKNIKDVHFKIRTTGKFHIIGYGNHWQPEYPQYKEDFKYLSSKEIEMMKKDYNRISKKLKLLFEKASKPTIFLSHNVPFNTPLDKITNKNSPRYGYHYGSLVTKEIIKEHKPLVCIGGHMHEHFKKHKIGKTIAINSGYGGKVNIEMVLDNNKIKKLKFYGK